MKLLTYFALPILLLLTSCRAQRFDDDFYAAPCQRDRIGTVCFENDTRKLIKMEMADSKIEIEAYTSRCLEVYEGDQFYKGKQGTKRWKGWIAVFSCENYYVYLDR